MKRLLLAAPLVAFAIATRLSSSAEAQSPLPPNPSGPVLYEPQVSIRNGGVLEESLQYHREGHAYRSNRPGPYPPAGGWYGYGFPVSTYRWGWFGAEHYWPRVGWHSDYNGNCVRFAYRYGY